jgi:hypothetical protein
MPNMDLDAPWGMDGLRHLKFKQRDGMLHHNKYHNKYQNSQRVRTARQEKKYPDPNLT